MIFQEVNGLLIISDIVNNQLIKQKYSGYSKKEAKKRFNLYIESLKNGAKIIERGTVYKTTKP